MHRSSRTTRVTTTTTQKAQRATRIHALIPAAGRGARFGSDENKVFALLAGKPLILHTVECFKGIADTLTVIGRSNELERLEQICGVDGAVYFVKGGATRQESVRLGLEGLSAELDDLVLVHDGARPLVSRDVIQRCIHHTFDHDGAIAGYPIAETVKRVTFDHMVTETVDRSGLWTAQTPQASTYARLIDAYRRAAADGFEATDDASVLAYSGLRPIMVLGARENIKITSPEDLDFAEQWLANKRTRDMRVGFGYDIHRLQAGRKLVLGGVNIPSDVGLLGHSDADVVLHALCDALLGAAGQPDIGQLFPNTDPTFEGADSLHLLKEVVTRMHKLGYTVGNVDCCVIAEAPKISPYAQQMRTAISAILQVNDDRVSIKATTNEGMGSLGNGEGIACHATATLFARD